jgi:hypothetical protein
VEATVRELSGRPVRIEEADLFALVGADRDAVVEAFAMGVEYPIVVVGGAVVCAGSFEMDLIADAVAKASV